MQQQFSEDQIDQQNYQFEEDTAKVNALNLKWTLGFNFKLVNGVHNLTNDHRKEIFYASAHTGVIFDYANNQQRLLQGHCNNITCTAYCRSEDIIITADAGPDSMLIIWEAKNGMPKKTIFDPHPHGTQALDVSPDGRYIVTLSREESEKNLQTISFWEWSREKSCIVSTLLDQRMKDYQLYITFNQDNYQEFATTGKRRVIFWQWESNDKGFEFYSPAFQQNRILTQTVFIPNSTQAVTGTQDGYIIVWDISLIMEDYSQPEERRAIKVVNLMNVANKSETQQKKGNSSINILRIQDEYLVIGSSNGSIRFYDFQYRIISWFEDIEVGSITNISFSNESRQDNDTLNNKDDEESDENEKSYYSPDFIVVDYDAKITLLKASLFEEIDKDKKKGEPILSSIISPVVSISVRPNSSVLALSCENGRIYEWNFYEKTTSLKELEDPERQHIPICIDYSPDGRFLSVCTKSGTIHIYDATKVDPNESKYNKDQKEPKEPKEGKESKWQKNILQVSETDKAKPSILQQVFASDSKHLATMDEDYSVCLFTYDHRFNDVTKEKEWVFAGKHRVHHAPIRSIAFGETQIEDRNEIKLKLFSIGQDMNLVEYDVIEFKATTDRSKVDPYDRLKLKSIFPIEQECSPSACIWYPVNLYKEDVLLTINEDYKIKLWHIMKDKLKICKKTCLGPTFGGPIKRLLILNPNDTKNEYQDKYLAYATEEKVVGIIKLPLDGNPNKTMGLIAHPSKIVGISSTSDGKLFFTSGGTDFAINIWSVDFLALEENFFTQKQDEESEYNIFVNLLEGGPDGQTIRDLKDFFYYSQIRSKDEHTTKARKLDGKVPLDAIADMMRSMGYYPTDQEIENMKNEIKFSKYLETGEYVTELELNTFLKLFVNHRPVYGIGKNQISDALKTIVQMEQKDSSEKMNQSQVGVQISGKRLKEILLEFGEKMTEEELQKYIEILLGPNGKLPEMVNVDNLCDDLLGFEDMDSIQKEEMQENQEEQEQAEEQQEES